MKDSTNASHYHPAIPAFAKLREQEPNMAYLHFALCQQIWLEARGLPECRPSDYAMTILRVMSYSFLLSQGFSETEVQSQLIDVMQAFETEFSRLVESRSKDADRPMRRTRPAGSNVILFPQHGRK